MDEMPLKQAHPVCGACNRDRHRDCAGCKGCGCFRSAVGSALAGPKLPDPATYLGCDLPPAWRKGLA